MMATETSGQCLEELYNLTGNELLEVIDCLEMIEEIMPRAFGYHKETILETRRAIQFCLDSGAEFIGCGTTRICFADGPLRVVKIPYTAIGANASAREIENYENFQELPEEDWFDPEIHYVPTAACRYLGLGFKHIKLLTMERIWEFPRFGAELPRWVDWVDCGQVGYNSVGELVAYDL